MRSRLLCALLLTPMFPATAQWQISLLTGNGSDRGYTIDRGDPDHSELRPDHTSTTRLAVLRERGAWRLTLSGRYLAADLTIRGTSSAVVTPGALEAWGFGAEVGRRIAGTPGLPTLHVTLGMSRDRWKFIGLEGPPRWATSLGAALEAAVPVKGNLAGLVRGEVSTGRSIFLAEELPEGYDLRSGRRYGVMLGVNVGFGR